MVQGEDEFTVVPRLLVGDEGEDARWSAYVVRVELERFHQRPALKVGMVGTGTVRNRCREHTKDFGPVQLLRVWTLDDQTMGLEEDQRWKVVEQYEARLQFAPEIGHPSARLRRLRPDRRIFSFEWFEDDDLVLPSLDRVALMPVTLPHEWAFGDPTKPTEGPGEAAIVPPVQA